MAARSWASCSVPRRKHVRPLPRSARCWRRGRAVRALIYMAPLYGPACIAATERGRGLLSKLYNALKERHPGREAILFIRRDNGASLRAHKRLGMREVAGFVLDGEEFAVFSDRAEPQQA